MVRALVIGLMQSANRASAGILIKNFNFGRNTGNKDHGSTLPGVLEYWSIEALGKKKKIKLKSNFLSLLHHSIAPLLQFKLQILGNVKIELYCG